MMKKTIYAIILVLLFTSVKAQESINLKFTVVSNVLYPIKKVQLTILNKSYIVSTDQSLSIKVTPNFKSKLEIKCKASSIDQLSYFFTPFPAQNYEFELGKNTNGFYITLKNIDAVKLGLLPYVKEDTTKDKTPQVYRNNLGLNYNATKDGKTASVRDEWVKRGGKISYYSIMGTGTYFRLDLGKLGTVNGYGGGASVAMNTINLKVPEHTAGVSKWNSLNFGAGMDLNIYGTSLKSEVTPGTAMDMKMTYLDLMFTGNIGWTWGFGKFIDEGNWSGFALTMKYRPSYVITTTSTEVKITGFPSNSTSNTDGRLNAGGFGFDVDFNSFSATMNRLAPKPKSKVSFFVLPPIGDNPLFVSLSYGLTFYSK